MKLKSKLHFNCKFRKRQVEFTLLVFLMLYFNNTVTVTINVQIIGNQVVESDA
jgi:hypothetical protein